MRYFWITLVCSAAVAQQAEAPTPARVAGVTLNGKGGPLRRSLVKLVGVKTYTQTSDEQGAFVFDNVAPGTYALLAARRGYYTQKYGGKAPLIEYCPNADLTEESGLASSGVAIQKECYGRAPGSMLTLAAGEEMKSLKLNLSPLAALTGQVTNQDGEPVGAWRVQAMKFTYERGQRRIEGNGFGAATDTEGNFSIDGLAPGRYYLYAMNATGNSFGGLMGERPGKAQKESDLPTFYPGASEISQAAPMEVTAGADLHGFDIHVRRSKVYSIRGKVNAPSGSDVKTQILTLDAKSDVSTWQTQRRQKVNEDGTFEFRSVEPGVYAINAGQAFANPGLPPPLFGRQEVTVPGADVDGVIVPMAPGIDMAGTIRVEGKKPDGWPFIDLEPLDGGNGALIQGIDSTGAFKFPRKVGPSTYLVRVSGLRPGGFVKSIAYGRQDALHAPLDLTGETSGSLDIVLSSNVATVSGKVANDIGEAVAGVVVSAWARKPQMIDPVKSVTTDQNGNFEIGDLGPGDYFVAAFEEIEPSLGAAPEFLSKFQSLAVAVVLEEGGHTNVDVKLISRERIAAEAAKLK